MGGRVVLARDARPQRDPGLILRVATASANTGLPISATTLHRLAADAPELRAPWPREVRHDLLLPDVATHRDIENPATVRSVAGTLDHDPHRIELLSTLVEADSLATGPGVWGEWKATPIGELVRRCRTVMADARPSGPEPGAEGLAGVAASGGVSIELSREDRRYTYRAFVVAPSSPGLLANAAGVLALHSLRVLSAAVGGTGESVAGTYVVTPVFGEPPDSSLLRQELERALAGRLDVRAALAAREPATPSPVRRARAEPRLLWSPTPTAGQYILELRAEGRAGLLCRVAAALTAAKVDVHWVDATTRGVFVVDVFCVGLGAGDSAGRRAEVDEALLSEVSWPAEGPRGEASWPG